MEINITDCGHIAIGDNLRTVISNDGTITTTSMGSRRDGRGRRNKNVQLFLPPPPPSSSLPLVHVYGSSTPRVRENILLRLNNCFEHAVRECMLSPKYFFQHKSAQSVVMNVISDEDISFESATANSMVHLDCPPSSYDKPSIDMGDAKIYYQGCLLYQIKGRVLRIPDEELHEKMTVLIEDQITIARKRGMGIYHAC